MSGGLVELVLVFGLVLGWGFVELRATRLDKKKGQAGKPEASETRPDG